MAFDPQNLREFNRRFMQIVRAVVKQSPADWSGGILVVEKTPEGVCCTLSESATGEAISVNNQVIQRSQSFADFKRTDNWANDWSKLTIQYSIEDPSVDYTATRKFTYPETSQPADTPSFPDAAFGRQETANNAWQRSPSLLVIELILDCKDCDAADEDTSAQAIHFSQKFCSSKHSVDWNAYLENYSHDISAESVYSAESVGAQAIVQTALKQAETETFFEYRLVHNGDRWFLDRVRERATRSENTSDLGFDWASKLL